MQASRLVPAVSCLLPALLWGDALEELGIDIDAIEYSHGHSLVFELQYAADFEHFDYVDPDAPRQGELGLSSTGTFDSFNHWAGRGRSAAGLDGTNMLFYDRLLYRTADEPSARYGLLAEGVAVDEDSEWIAFKLREGAYFHDGTPITVEDVIFTFDTLQEHGSVGVRTNLRDVIEARRIGEREVIFINDADGVNNRNVIEHIGNMEILPKHYWEDRDPGRTTSVPPLGSGPYRIVEHRMGRFIRYERDPDYWANDLPHLRGRYNFERIQYDYYRDAAVRMQALRNGDFDLAIEPVAKNWSVEYDFDGYHEGYFKKWQQEQATPAGLWWPVFWNLRRERFQDIRVREALWLLTDFAYVNRVLMYGYYDHARSFFQGSPMAHRGTPSAAELELLEPFRDELPERVFTQEYNPPPAAGSGYNRDNVKRALELFAEAGWEVDDGRMVHAETGQRFRIDFVVVSPALVRALMPYMETLEQIGIDTSARAPEQSQFLNRMQERQFDAGMQTFSPGALPGPALRHQFSGLAAMVPGSWNWAGIAHPAVDALIEEIIAADTEEGLLAATHAFDRVMLWSFYFIPGMADTGLRHVYWDRFGIPDAGAVHRSTYVDTWWYDEEHARRVDEWLGH